MKEFQRRMRCWCKWVHSISYSLTKQMFMQIPTTGAEHPPFAIWPSVFRSDKCDYLVPRCRCIVSWGNEIKLDVCMGRDQNKEAVSSSKVEKGLPRPWDTILWHGWIESSCRLFSQIFKKRWLTDTLIESQAHWDQTQEFLQVVAEGIRLHYLGRWSQTWRWTAMIDMSLLRAWWWCCLDDFEVSPP